MTLACDTCGKLLRGPCLQKDTDTLRVLPGWAIFRTRKSENFLQRSASMQLQITGHRVENAAPSSSPHRQLLFVDYNCVAVHGNIGTWMWGFLIWIGLQQQWVWKADPLMLGPDQEWRYCWSGISEEEAEIVIREICWQPLSCISATVC